jgi:hypothetical protein
MRSLSTTQRLFAALLIAVPMTSHGVFRCEDAQGNITFRDTPCPVRPDHGGPQPPRVEEGRQRPTPDGDSLPYDWLSIAQIANQIRLNSPISYVEQLLGEPEEQQRSGIRARYVFELPVLRGMAYQSVIYAVNNRVTAIHDTFRRHYIQGVVTPGMLYDEILMTWGEPDAEQLRRTTQGIETTLSYTTDEPSNRGNQVTLRDDVVVSIQYDVPLQR